MTRLERITEIIKLLNDKGSLSTEKLAKHFDKNAETINSDLSYLSSKDKVYFRRNKTGIRYVVLIPDNCKKELYVRVSVADWIESQKKK